MLVLKKINIDIQEKQNIPFINAVQGEKNSRVVQLQLFASGVEWSVPEGASAYASYKKSDGFGGIYDTLEDGTPAISVSGNTISVTLAEQTLTTIGNVGFSVFLIIDNQVISTFPMIINVSENAGINAVESEDYFSIRAAINAAIVASQSPAFVVNINSDGDGFVADKTFQELTDAHNAGKILICWYYDEDLYLPLTARHGIFTFSAVYDGNEYIFNVFTEGTEDTKVEFQINRFMKPPETASVGQVLSVKAVDSDGRPTEFEASASRLPNPYALTFPDGTVYDGSQAVNAPAANDRSVATAYLMGGTGSQEFYLSGYSASELAAAARAGLEVLVYATENGMKQRYALIKKGQKSGGYTMVFAHIADLETRYLEVTDDGSAAGMIFLYSTVLDTDRIGAVPVPQRGAVGQALVVGEVDALGRPTSWETAPLSGGGNQWRLINTVTTTEDALSRVTCTTDSEGQPLSLTEVYVKTVLPASTTVSGSNFIYLNGGYFNGPLASTKVSYGSLYANGILDQVSSSNGDYAQWYLHGNRPIPNGPYITKVELVGQSGGKNIPLGTTLEIWGR